MIYYKDSTLIIPRHYSDNNTEKLTLKNNVTSNEQTFDLEGDESENPLYYKFAIELGNLPTGEYTYTVGKESGLLTIGDYVPTNTQYQINVNKIQYDRN